MGEDAPSIAIVDDDPAVLRSLLRLLRAYGFQVKGYASPQCLLSELDALSPDCIVADLVMPDTTGLELQATLAGLDRYPIVIITGNGDLQSSVQAMPNCFGLRRRSIWRAN